MIIAPNSCAREEGEVKRKYQRIWEEEEEGGADYRGMVRSSEQDVAPYEERG